MRALTWMGALGLAGCLAACAGTLAPIVPRIVPDAGRRSYRESTKVVVGAKANGADFLALPVTATNRGAAWFAPSSRFALPKTARAFALTCTMTTPCDWFDPEVSETYGNTVAWYDAAGRKIGRQAFDCRFRAHRPSDLCVTGAIPSAAVSAAVTFGCDLPNIPAGGCVRVENLRFQPLAADEPVPAARVPDVEPPFVKSAFSSPAPDPRTAVRYEITDATGVDWSSVTVTACVNAVTSAVPYVREGSVITLAPARPWAQGLNRLAVTARDVLGNGYTWRKVFVIGERARNVPAVTLRDDGVTLVDGRPFFPIGIYGVKPLAVNLWDYDRALGDLRRAGFNAVHTYLAPRKDEFLGGCRKHGLWTWSSAMRAATGDEWLATAGRAEKSVLAWYVGDDTSMYGTPWQVTERADAMRMLDDRRPTCQADGVRSNKRRSKFQDYVNCTDVFLPEIYPVFGNARDPECVAATVRDMERVRADVAAYGDGRPRGVWPILQIFHGNGKMWGRFPTADEMYGMTFAALVHGGTGVTWFHYGDKICLEEQRRYSGCFNTLADWTLLTNMTSRINALAPALLARTPPQPPAPKVVDGPQKDPLGQNAVTMLLKTLEKETYVLAVNASPQPVKAEFSVPVACRRGEVLWENRSVSAASGRFADSFKGFGVHVYRFE